MSALRAFSADTFRSLRTPNFGRFFAGQAISQTGTWMQMVAITILVFQLTDSGLALGLATAAQFAPILVLGAWAGLLADRSDRHRLLLGMNVAGMLVAGAFGALVLTGSEALWSVYALTVAAGTVTALENPARRAFVTDLVEEDMVANAVGLNSALMTGSRVIGPAMAGALVAGPGIGWAFAINALSFLPQLWLFARMDRSRFRAVAPVPRGRGQLREGFRYVWGTPELRLPLLLVAAVGTLAFNFTVIFPLFSQRDLGGGPALFTTLFSVMSAGAVLGALAIARRRTADARFLSLATLALGGSIAALALAPNVTLAVALSLPVGATSMLVISGANTAFQLTSAPQMRGRVLALLSVVFLGSTPIGGPIAGLVAEFAGARAALGMGALGCFAAAILTLRAVSRSTPAGAGGPRPRHDGAGQVPLTAAGAQDLAPRRQPARPGPRGGLRRGPGPAASPGPAGR